MTNVKRLLVSLLGAIVVTLGLLSFLMVLAGFSVWGDIKPDRLQETTLIMGVCAVLACILIPAGYWVMGKAYKRYPLRNGKDD